MSLQQATNQGSRNCYERVNQTENIYVPTRANISTVMNEVVGVHCKAVTTQVFTVLLIELGTAMEKSKGYLASSPSIR